MTKVKLRETLLKGNIKRMEELANEYGISLQNFLYILAEANWYCLSRDVIVYKKAKGEKIPKELEFLDKPQIVQIKKENTERLEIYVEPKTKNKLKIKTKMYALRTIGLLFDKICSEPLEFPNPDLLNSIKHNGGKK